MTYRRCKRKMKKVRFFLMFSCIILYSCDTVYSSRHRVGPYDSPFLLSPVASNYLAGGLPGIQKKGGDMKYPECIKKCSKSCFQCYIRVAGNIVMDDDYNALIDKLVAAERRKQWTSETKSLNIPRG
jgi:hypothetical protein